MGTAKIGYEDLIEEMLQADQVLADWYRTKLALQYPIEATASRSGVDMTKVLATAGTIDLSAVCDDEECAQKGLPYKDHTVVHKTKGAKRGLRGTCPTCQGPMHNLKDDAKLIAFACLWRQKYGDQAAKTVVNAVTLAGLVDSITSGKIKAWADRGLLLTAMAGAAPKPSAPATATTSASPAPSGVKTTTASSRSASPAPSAVQSPSPAPAAAPTTAKEDAERRRKMGELLKGAKSLP